MSSRHARSACRRRERHGKTCITQKGRRCCENARSRLQQTRPVPSSRRRRHPAGNRSRAPRSCARVARPATRETRETKMRDRHCHRASFTLSTSNPPRMPHAPVRTAAPAPHLQAPTATRNAPLFRRRADARGRASARLSDAWRLFDGPRTGDLPANYTQRMRLGMEHPCNERVFGAPAHVLGRPGCCFAFREHRFAGPAGLRTAGGPGANRAAMSVGSR